MGKKILINDEDGRLVVHAVAPGVDPTHHARRAGLLGKAYTVIDDADAPTTALGLDAWKLDRGAVSIDMEKAKAAHMATIRRARAEELAALDVEWMKAQDAGDSAKAAEVGRKRQRLRDLPQTFNMNSARTPDELLKLWPDDLAGRKPTRPGKGGEKGKGRG